MSSYFPQFTQQTLIRSSTSSVDSNGQPFPGLRYTSHRSRYYASKGFEDDLEFCPEIEPSSPSAYKPALGNNPYAALNNYQDFSQSPLNSPTRLSNSPNSSSSYSYYSSYSSYQPTEHSPTSRPSTPRRGVATSYVAKRVKRPIEIVDPHTGLRVGSPSPRK